MINDTWNLNHYKLTEEIHPVEETGVYNWTMQDLADTGYKFPRIEFTQATMLGIDQIKSKLYPCSSYDFSVYKYNSSILEIFNITDIKNIGLFNPLFKTPFRKDEA